jgi:hypothetical protein
MRGGFFILEHHNSGGHKGVVNVNPTKDSMGHNSLLGMGFNVQSITTTRIEDSDVVFFEDVPPQL